jgi:hypothetical protein
MPVRAVAAVARGVRMLALVAGAAALVIAVALLGDGVSAVDLLGAALAAVPPLLLYAFSAAVRALAELPDKVRAVPADARGHAGTLVALGREARRARLLRLPLIVWRAGRVAGEARELLAPYAPALPLLSPVFLGASALAVLAVPVEVVVALVLLAT